MKLKIGLCLLLLFVTASASTLLVAQQPFRSDYSNRFTGDIVGYGSPIVIDLGGDDFPNAFTSVGEGIVWDFLGRGKGGEVMTGWTRKEAKVGFLYLDRNRQEYPCFNADPLLGGQDGCNGKVDSSKELFGDITRQRPPEGFKSSPSNPYDSNGFEALRQLDGNKDGVIDRQDPAYEQLGVWVDTCHCGDSTKGTRHTLPELHIAAISLSYYKSERKDQYGNEMRFVGSLIMDAPVKSMPAIYDVFFIQARLDNR